jgi:ligand-binding SRPBCC domain-containing protein
VDGGTECLDRVAYELPFGPLGELMRAIWIHRQLNFIFNYRSEFLKRRFGLPP